MGLVYLRAFLPPSLEFHQDQVAGGATPARLFARTPFQDGQQILQRLRQLGKAPMGRQMKLQRETRLKQSFRRRRRLFNAGGGRRTPGDRSSYAPSPPRHTHGLQMKEHTLWRGKRPTQGKKISAREKAVRHVLICKPDVIHSISSSHTSQVHSVQHKFLPSSRHTHSAFLINTQTHW